MSCSEKILKQCEFRIVKAQVSIMMNHGFYGRLLSYISLKLCDEHETGWTDWNEEIYLNPQFVMSLSDTELEYALLHLLLHIVFRHLERKKKRDDEKYMAAADMVINSNIWHACSEDNESICLKGFGGVQPYYVSPSFGPAYKYTVEEVYSQISLDGVAAFCYGVACMEGGKWDYHDMEKDKDSCDGGMDETWVKRINCAISSARRRAGNGPGDIPSCIDRYTLKKRAQLDWRTLLNDFVQEDVTDYSFNPPDKRYDDETFFLPDFNERTESVKKILFMIDTSGSMNDDEISQCYSEVYGALEQYEGKLEGWVGFFDSEVKDPIPFVEKGKLNEIVPRGGGGTSFTEIFEYIQNRMIDDLPVSIIVLTDGYADFPKEEASLGIPVLWILDNNTVMPPWGKIARISVGER